MFGRSANRYILFSAAMAASTYAALTDASQGQSLQLYQEPNLGTQNIRILENQIKIHAPHTAVFDYVTTWSNVPKWLPLTKKAEVVKGNKKGPSQLGDHLEEVASGSPPLRYTVAVSYAVQVVRSHISVN